MLKKQIAAMNRILDWERFYRKDKPCGAHPSGDGYVITDGRVAILFQEKPDDFPEADRQDDLYKLIQNDWKNRDCVLAFTVTADMVKDWKRLAREWKCGKTVRNGAHPVEVTAQREDGTKVSGLFNPAVLVNAVEAVGTGCMVYVGYTRWCTQRPAIFILPKDWMETGPGTMGFVLPLRI